MEIASQPSYEQRAALTLFNQRVYRWTNANDAELRSLLYVLGSCADKDDWTCFPSIATIAIKYGESRVKFNAGLVVAPSDRTVKRWLRELRNIGILSAEQRFGGRSTHGRARKQWSSNRYTINFMKVVSDGLLVDFDFLADLAEICGSTNSSPDASRDASSIVASDTAHITKSSTESPTDSENDKADITNTPHPSGDVGIDSLDTTSSGAEKKTYKEPRSARTLASYFSEKAGTPQKEAALGRQFKTWLERDDISGAAIHSAIDLYFTREQYAYAEGKPMWQHFIGTQHELTLQREQRKIDIAEQAAHHAERDRLCSGENGTIDQDASQLWGMDPGRFAAMSKDEFDTFVQPMLAEMAHSREERLRESEVREQESLARAARDERTRLQWQAQRETQKDAQMEKASSAYRAEKEAWAAAAATAQADRAAKDAHHRQLVKLAEGRPEVPLMQEEEPLVDD